MGNCAVRLSFRSLRNNYHDEGQSVCASHRGKRQREVTTSCDIWLSSGQGKSRLGGLDLQMYSMYFSQRSSENRVYRVATAAFWRTFHHEAKISPGWWGWGVHAHPLSLHLPSPVKLKCTLQLSGQTHYVSSLVKICTLWSQPPYKYGAKLMY